MSKVLPKKDIRIFYRTTDMMLTPNMFVERSEKFPNEVAVAATFAPSFHNHDEDTKLNSTEIPANLPTVGSEFHFVFIIDRSGSMGINKMKMANEALKLFLQSLPVGCKFSIISFGGKYEVHTKFGELSEDTGVWEYSDEVLEAALKEVGKFESNFGGT